MQAARGEDRQQGVQLAEAHQRLAADDREVDRLVLVDQLQHALHERVALVVGDLAQRDVAAEMIVAEGIAARATQRTLTRDFDRQVRRAPAQDLVPTQ